MMSSKIQDMITPREHDNRDGDIIIINKDSLVLKLFRSKEFYNSSNSAFGFGGIASALLLAGYLTETFHGVGYIPGETIRAVFIMLGIVSAAFAIKSFLSWRKLKDTHEPVQVVSSLLINQYSTPSVADTTEGRTKAVRRIKDSL